MADDDIDWLDLEIIIHSSARSEKPINDDLLRRLAKKTGSDPDAVIELHQRLKKEYNPGATVVTSSDDPWKPLG